MKKYVSLFMLATTLFATSGCHKKKQTASQIELKTSEKNIVDAKFLVDATAENSKEDYTITT